jgi:hypothetical protein
MNPVSHKSNALYCLVLLLFITACQNMQALYSEQAYQQAVTLKVESLNLMDKATESYDLHKEEVGELKIALQKAHEYAKGRPQNTESTRQWEIMIDPEGSLLGGFLRMWEEKGQIPSAMVEETKGNIEEGFDIIMELESGKREQ